jgi:hypothetical protein
MKVYLSAQYGRQSEMCHYANDLRAIGWDVVSSWIESEGNGPGDSGQARQDQIDMDESDSVIYFSGPPYVGTIGEQLRGSRHVEFGYCWGKGKGQIVIGEYENLFQRMPHVVRFENWESFMNYVRL